MAIEIAAKKRGISEDEVVQTYNTEYQSLFEKINIHCDIFSRTHTPIHQEFAKDMFKKLQAN